MAKKIEQTPSSRQDQFIILAKVAQELTSYEFNFKLHFEEDDISINFSSAEAEININNESIIFNEYMGNTETIGQISDPEIFEKIMQFMLIKAAKGWSS